MFNLKAVMSMYHYSLKISIPHGVDKIEKDKEAAEKCQMKIYPVKKDAHTSPGVYMVYMFRSDLNPSLKIKGEKPVRELDKVSISPNDPPRELKIGHELQSPIKSHTV